MGNTDKSLKARRAKAIRYLSLERAEKKRVKQRVGTCGSYISPAMSTPTSLVGVSSCSIIWSSIVYSVFCQQRSASERKHRSRTVGSECLNGKRHQHFCLDFYLFIFPLLSCSDSDIQYLFPCPVLSCPVLFTPSLGYTYHVYTPKPLLFYSPASLSSFTPPPSHPT